MVKTTTNEKEPVYVDSHKNGGYTHLRFENVLRSIDVPTQIIPAHLRNIGSRFLLSWRHATPDSYEEGDAFDKSEYYKFEVHEINPEQ